MTEANSLDRGESASVHPSSGRRRQNRIPSFADLRRHWREDYAVNGRNLWQPGNQAVALYRFGVWVDGHPNRFVRYPLRKLYQFLYLMVRNLYGIEIPIGVRIGRRLKIAHQSGIVISPLCRIGDDCLIHHNVTIGQTRTGVNPEDGVRIGDRVEIGTGAVVLNPARIGHDTRIGPNVVLREDVPPFSKILPPRHEVRPRVSRTPTPR